MKAWLFQDARQKAKLGADKCPWSVGWLDPEGHRKSKKIGPKSRAEKYARKIEGELAAGVYHNDSRKKWDDFVTEHEARILNSLRPASKESARIALKHFQEIVNPVYVRTITTAKVDQFTAERLKQEGMRKGDTVSPATVNRELRHIKAALRIAAEWGYLPVMPKVRMVKEQKKLARYVTAEHFAAIYKACDVAIRPQSEAYSAADWWRALLTFCYMTGWRISEPTALRWDDVSLDEGWAITRAADNKGGRDERAPLHPVVVDHLRKIVDPFCRMVFYWPHNPRSLWVDFGAIQDAAGIHLPCPGRHVHKPTCHRYGFHDLRRSFATVNAPKLTADALQALMRHKSYQTTQRYINMTRQLDEAVAGLTVPEVLRERDGN